MPRWLEITLTLILFAVLMGLAGAVVRAAVPSIDAWMVETVGERGFSALVATVILGAGVYAYLGHRKPKGASGR